MVRYPSSVPPRTTRTLDAAEELVPLEQLTGLTEDTSRYIALSMWLDALVTLGLLTSQERAQARSDIGPNM